MSTSFRRYEPDQTLLLPPSARDWLPEDHLAYFISDTLESLQLRAFYAPYQGDGRRNQPFEPRMMLKVLVYAYATGTFSSRKIARKLYEDVAYRVLGAENFPKHRTIAEFRQRHLGEFHALFEQVVRLAGELGLVRLGTVAVDGTKLKADASKHKAMSYGRMEQEERRLREEIRELTAHAEAVDAEEDAQYGPDRTGEEIPEELVRRESRLQKIQEAKARLEQRQKAQDEARGREPEQGRKSPRGGRNFKRDFGIPDAQAQENFTDPDSRIMRAGSGYEQCYNAQIAVDAEHRLIVSADVAQSAADVEQLVPALDAIEESLGEPPQRVLADAGYKSEANFQALEERGIDGYIALGRGEKDPVRSTDPRYSATARMARKLRTQRGRKRYRARKHIAEPPFGWIKSILGFHRFHLRGFEPVRGEWDLTCLAANMRRLHAMMAWT
jgi:transposase